MKPLLLVLPIVCAMACGSSSSLDPFTSPVAGPSGCPYSVYRHNPSGWLLTEPEVHMDFWGDWKQWADAVNVTQPKTFLNDWRHLLNKDGVLSRLSEYGVHEGTMDPILYTDTGSTTLADDGGVDAGANGFSVLDDTTFATALNAEIQIGSIPYPNSNTLYVVMLPPNVTSYSMVTNHWGGYHTHASYAGQAYAYAIIGYTGNLVVTSHEIYEASTNPNGDGYWDDASGDEVADLCEPYTEVIDTYTVQKVWSQTLCQCQ